MTNEMGSQSNDGTKRFRVEAEVFGEERANTLKGIIEDTEGYTLTAFDPELDGGDDD